MSTQHNAIPGARLSRRDFLKVSSLAGGGLLFGVYLAACVEEPTETPTAAVPTAAASETPSPEPTEAAISDAVLEPNVFFKIGADNVITIRVHKSEMGQGVRTSLPMVIAEELGADWSQIRVEQAPTDRHYGDQSTGGSDSTFETFNPLRRAGAVAREMLLEAAAATWQVPQDTCYADHGMVIQRDTNQSLTFGELVETAATLEVPSSTQVPLKDPEDFKLIGTRVARVDHQDIVQGLAAYGLDIKIPGMLYAVIARAPMLGGILESFNADQALSIAGVRRIVEIDRGVAVVADNTWAALQGRTALGTIWREGGYSEFSTESARTELLARAEEGAAFDVDDQTFQAIYEVPYYAHATMEPMNCIADVRSDGCDIWAPTQAPTEAKAAAMRHTDLREADIHVHVTLLGGGFGRRLETDYVDEAVQVSKAVRAPVQVVWTREDDMQNDFFHPFTYHLARTRLDQLSLPDVTNYNVRSGAPTGAWRSVTNIPAAFVRESFLDEMAFAAGMDPLEIRRTLEPEDLLEVLEVAASQSDWGAPLPEGWGRGVACHATWNSTPVAIVAEVSVDGGGQCQVHRVVCAVDCGIAINPDMVEAQMEGGIVFGLTAALKGSGITFENGRVQQSNFHDFPLWRFDEMPRIEVHIIPSSRLPHGVGEMSTPPLIPAIANAIFSATGKRIRHLPITRADLAQA